MQRLRRGAVEEIRRNLNRGFLTQHSFNIEANAPDGRLLQVQFKDRPEFCFTILHPQTDRNGTNGWKTTECPGRHFTEPETYDHAQFQQAFGAVYGWADRVAEEILLEAKTQRDSSIIEGLRRNLDQTADQLTDPDKPFTPEELEEWSSQLERLVTRLGELEQQNEIQRGRVEQLSRELEELKRQGTSIPKRTWLKAAGNKILDLLDSASKAAVKSLAEGAVKALLEHKP